MVEYIIRQALNNHSIIDIIYMTDKGISERRIRPIKWEANILEAFCYAKKSIRRFKLENILSASSAKDKKAG